MAHDDLTDAGPLNTQSCKMHDQPSPEVDSEVKKAEASRAHAIDGAVTVVPAAEIQSQEEFHANPVILEAFAKSSKLAAKVLKVLEEGFEATRPYFNKQTQGWDHLPDYKVRQAAVECYLAHTIGLPVQKTETKNINLTGKIPSGKRPPPTPALLAHYARELEKAKRQGAGKIKPEAPTSEE